MRVFPTTSHTVISQLPYFFFYQIQVVFICSKILFIAVDPLGKCTMKVLSLCIGVQLTYQKCQMSHCWPRYEDCLPLVIVNTILAIIKRAFSIHIHGNFTWANIISDFLRLHIWTPPNLLSTLGLLSSRDSSWKGSQVSGRKRGLIEKARCSTNVP